MYAFKPLTFTKLEPSSNCNPMPRSGHRIVCDDTFMYSFGGYNNTIPDKDPQLLNDKFWQRSKPLFKEIWKFNITTQEWSLLPNQSKLPAELVSMAVLLRGNILVIQGGSGCPFGERNSNQTYFCHLVSGKFSTLQTTGEKPEPEYGQAIVQYDKYLYSIGGTNGLDYNCDTHRLDLTTNVWESVYICGGKESCEPSGRYRHEVAFDGTRIFVFGGGTSEQTFNLKRIPVYDIVSNKWSNVKTKRDKDTQHFPRPRRCHGLVQYTDELAGTIYVVISGGFDGDRLLSDVWKLNLQTLTWTCLKSLPRPIYFHSSTVTPSGRMFIFGGITKYNLPNNDEVTERTNAVQSIWLSVPKLTEICWLAMNHYFPHLKCLPDEQLLSTGIPVKFLKRLKGMVDVS